MARQGPESYGLGDSSWLSPRVTGFPDEGRRPQGDSALVGLSQKTWDKGWVASWVRALEPGSRWWADICWSPQGWPKSHHELPGASRWGPYAQ